MHVNLCVSVCVGKPLQLHLQACDVKSKEEKSGPENMLMEPNSGDGMQTIYNIPNDPGFKICAVKYFTDKSPEYWDG